MDSTYSFDITTIMLSFTITATIAYVLTTGINIHILFQKPIPFYNSTKVFIVITYRAYTTFTVLAFAFFKIA